MGKLLTFSVAAYNVKNTISRTLESLILKDSMLMDKMEVLIVDDGSTDNTYKVVEEYVSRYPEVFKYCRKENGGHGSTLSFSIRHANGKYLRMLDGDDWVNTGALEKYLLKLERCDSDVVVTPYTYVCEEEEIVNRHPIKNGYKYDINQAFEEGLQSLHAHEVAVKVEILRKENVSLLEHCMFVDSEFCFYVELFSNSVVKFEENVYQYRIDRDGQSISPTGRMKHIFDARRIAIKELNYLADYISSLSDTSRVRCYNQIDRVSNMQLENYNGYAKAVNLSLRQEVLGFMDEIKVINPEYFTHMLNAYWVARYEKMLLESDINRTIVIFGAGKRGKLAVEVFDELECKNELFVVDNNKAIEGQELNGHAVRLAEDVVNAINSDYIVFVAMKNNVQEVKEQLLRLGMDENRIIL